MSQATAVLLGAIAGATIFLGLPVARLRGLPKGVQGFLNAFATGILVFLLWDILSHAGEPVKAALAHVHADAQRLRAGFFTRGKNENRQQEEEQSASHALESER